MKILLTGNRGYIGQRLQQLLVDGGHFVYGIDLKNGKNLIDCSLNYDVDVVIHLAGRSGVRESISDPKSYWLNNVECSKRLFNHFSDTRIIYASSSSAYEPHLNPYAASKLLLEHAAKNHPNALGLRIHTTYSDTPREGMFFDKLAKGTLEYVTDHYRDFVHLDDVCNAIILLLNKNIRGVIDVGTGKCISVKSLAGDLPVKTDTPHERKLTRADSTILFDMGWKPRII